MRTSYRRSKSKMCHVVHALLFLAGMALFLTVIGWFIAEEIGVLSALLLVIVLSAVPTLSPQVLFRMYGARQLTAANAPTLIALVQTLAQRAGLLSVPQLYYIPSLTLNAFVVGQEPQAGIGLTEGLLRHLTRRELAGILAHEISHIRQQDTWVMGLADVMRRVTALNAMMGLLLLAITVPSMLLHQSTPPWLLIGLFLSAPTLSALLQLALSRTQEFDADIDAAWLTGDPIGLIMALMKLERVSQNLFERLPLPGARLPDPSVLRTHPPLVERIQRLCALAEESAPYVAAPSQ